MTLAHGVENRCPFLDPAVVETACAINPKFYDGLAEKRILREAFRGRLPDTIVSKRKFPYRAPDAAAFAAHPQDYLELLQSESELAKVPYLDRKFARALTKKVLASPSAEISTKENQAFVFLLSLVFLHHLFVERRGANRPFVESPIVRAVDLRPTA